MKLDEAYQNPPRGDKPDCRSDSSLAWIAPSGDIYGLSKSDHTGFAWQVVNSDKPQFWQDIKILGENPLMVCS
mgnify:CR=1 FL=1